MDYRGMSLGARGYCFSLENKVLIRGYCFSLGCSNRDDNFNKSHLSTVVRREQKTENGYNGYGNFL
jgi:hypothetical protein